MYKCLFFIVILLFSSCGIYNLDLSIKNPLDSINIFSFLSNKKSKSAEIFQCQMEINANEWDSAIETCSSLEKTDSNVALMASALHGKHGGNLFNLIEVAGDDEGKYSSLIHGYTTTLSNTGETAIEDLDESVTLLQGITVKTTNNYFQLGFTHFTLACSYISKAAADNGNPDGDIRASDIEYMNETELNAFYSNLEDSKSNLSLAGTDGDIFDGIDDDHFNLGDWGSLNEIGKETVVKALFGL